MFARLLVVCLAALLLPATTVAFNRTASNVQSPSATAIERLQSIDHFIVIMLENESFDQLFPNFPGAENLLDWILGRSPNGIPYFEQTDLAGNVMSSLPTPQCSGKPCGNFPASLPNSPFLATAYWSENATSSFDATHRYYQEQWQINGGAMNRYAAWAGSAAANSNGIITPSATAWAMQFWNITTQYMGQLGMNYTVFDHFFHSYFGGSTPGAVSVFAGDLPYYNGSSTGCPTKLVAAFNGSAPTVDGSNFTLDGVLDTNCRMINDVYVPGFGSTANFLPTNQTSIGDVFDAAGVSWAWYAQNWNEAYAGRPNNLSTAHFAYHHHAPLYYQPLANFTSPYFLAHMQDEINFFTALNTNTGLPSVSYVRPSPDDDMHPAQNNPVLAQAHLQAYFEAIFASDYWLSNKTAVLITFDENGGYFDHVPPYVGDADGPGTRVPVVLVSPFHNKGGVNSYPYENLSFLKMMQTRYNLPTSTIAEQRVNTVRDLTNSFAEPSIAPSSASSTGSPATARSSSSSSASSNSYTSSSSTASAPVTSSAFSTFSSSFSAYLFCLTLVLIALW